MYNKLEKRENKKGAECAPSKVFLFFQSSGNSSLSSDPTLRASAIVAPRE
jgi:hypothetical protein